MDLSYLGNILLPIFGIFIGAAIQYRVSKTLEERKSQGDLRTQAYVDFLRSSAGLASNENVTKYTTLLIEAKARITIYGNKEVIQAAANFFRAGGSLNTLEQRKLYLAICQEMRKQGLPKEPVTSNDMAQLLFGSDLEAK